MADCGPGDGGAGGATGAGLPWPRDWLITFCRKRSPFGGCGILCATGVGAAGSAAWLTVASPTMSRRSRQAPTTIPSPSRLLVPVAPWLPRPIVSSPCPLLELLYTLQGADDIRDANTELVVDNHNLTARNEFLIDQDFKGLTNLFGQFDHRPLT